MLKKSWLWPIVFSFVCIGMANGANVNKEGFIGRWLVCGPFPNLGPMCTEEDHATVKVYAGWEKDWLLEHGGEEKIEPKEGMSYQVVFPDYPPHGFWESQEEKVTIKWQVYSNASAEINLLKAFSNKTLNIDDTKDHLVRFVVGYAYCVVNSPEDRDAVIAFGSDDGYKIYLNHRFVAGDDSRRGIKEDENKFPVRLKKGRNTLLVKVDQSLGGYGFVLRFLSADGTMVIDDLDIELE